MTQIPKKLHVKFANDSVCEIELLQNELVELWYTSFNHNKQVGFYTKGYDPTLHSIENVVDKPLAVEKINDSIQQVELITGCDWNIRAESGMGFETTNAIHRMFTTSITTNLRTNHVSDEIAQYISEQKQTSYMSHNDISDMIDKWSKEHQTYQYSDNARGELEQHLQTINAFIHIYEIDGLYSERSKNIKIVSNALANDLDLKRIDGSYLHDNPMEPIISTRHIPHLNTTTDANVYALKKILGKDYLTCYYDHDDPLQWDITMANTIDGSFVIDYEGIYEYSYNTEDFQHWVKEYKLKDKHTYSNVQIGRVTNTWCEEFQRYTRTCPANRPICVSRDPIQVSKESEVQQIEPQWRITEIKEIFV